MKKIWSWARLLISAALIGYLITSVDFGEIGASLSRSNPTFIVLSALSALGDRLMMAFKWNLLLRAKGIRIPLVDVTGTYMISSFLGLFLPPTVGGDAVRAYAVAKEGHSTGDIVSSIVVERVLGILALLVFVLGSIAFSLSVFGQDFFANIYNLFWLVLSVAAALLALVLLSIYLPRFARRVPRLRNWPQKLAGHRLVGKLVEVYQSYLSYQKERAALGWFLLLSFAENLFPILNVYFLSLAFGIDVPLLYYFILVPIDLVLVRLPISIAGIGIHEGTFVYFLTLIGVSQPDALLLGIASHILIILSLLPGGLLYAFSGLGFKTGGRRAELLRPAGPEPQEALEK